MSYGMIVEWLNRLPARHLFAIDYALHGAGRDIPDVTDDSHPIHLHLVRFQILDRRRFDTFEFQASGNLRITGPAQPPAPEESGWKDTVRADPAMVTRIIIPFEGYPGRYVWHCHILEHEDNEMMRPYDVLRSAV